MLACLLACKFACLLACHPSCRPVRLVAWELGGDAHPTLPREQDRRAQWEGERPRNTERAARERESETKLEKERKRERERERDREGGRGGKEGGRDKKGEGCLKGDDMRAIWSDIGIRLKGGSKGGMIGGEREGKETGGDGDKEARTFVARGGMGGWEGG